MSVIVDIGEDLIDAVDDFVGDVIDFTVDVVEGALDDPIGTIATVAAVATGNAWAVPLIQGANVAIQGGDLGDIVKTVAISYAAGKLGQAVGQSVGQYASEAAAAGQYGTQFGSAQTAMLAAQEAGMLTASDIAASVIGAGTGSATVAVVTGRDPVQAFFTGGISAAVPAALGNIEGFDKLSVTSQKVINSAVTSAMLGQDVTGATVAAIISSSNFTTKMVNSISDYTGGGTMTDGQQALITNVISQTAAAAFAGGDPSTAFQNALLREGTQQLGDMLLSDEFISSTKEFFGLGTQVTETAELIEDNEKSQQAVIDKYNGVANTITTRQENQQKLYDAMMKARDKYESDKNQTTFDAANNATKAYNDYTTKLNNDYTNTYKKQLDDYSAQLDMLKEEHVIMVEDWGTYQEKFMAEADSIDLVVRPLYDSASEFFVQEMDPGFNADEYVMMNGLGPEVNPYQHWLEVGQYQGLPTNYDRGFSVAEGERTLLIDNILRDNGLSLSNASSDTLANLYGLVFDEYRTPTGAMDYAGLSQDSKGLRERLANDQSFKDAIAETQVREGVVINRPYTAETLPANGLASWEPAPGWTYATQDQVLKGEARLITNRFGDLVYVTPGTDAGRIWIPSVGDLVDYDSVLIRPTEDGGVPILPPVLVTAPSLDDLWDMDPEAYLVTMSSMPVETAVENGIDEFFIRMAQSAVEAAEASGNETLINTTANIIRATGGISQAFGATIGLLSGDTPVDSNLYKFGDALAKLGEASNTQEYKDRIAFIKESIGEADGFWETTQAIFDQAIQDPAVFAAEFIGVEATQELIPLAIGGVAGAGVKGVALARGVATEIAETMGRRAAISAALASDVAESVGATAEETYNTSYVIAIREGLSEADAEAWALQNAQKSAVVAGVVTMAAGGMGNAALEKAIFGSRVATAGSDEALNAIINTIKNSTEIAIKEGVSEYGEEAIITASQEAMYSVLDPNRDVSGNIATAGTLGMIASGSIAGGVSLADGVGSTTGDMVRNMILSSSGVENIRQTATSVDEAYTALQELGIADDPYITAAVYHDVAPSEYASVGQINADITKAIQAETGSDVGNYTFGANDFANFVGVKTPDLGSAIQEYVDNRYTNFAEAKSYLVSQGYTNPTAAEVNNFVKQGMESETELLIREFADPLVTDYNEARQMLLDLGYTDPRDAEINRFVGKYAETLSKDKVSAYVDPRQVTEAEAREYFDALGYNPTQAEVDQFVRHGWTVNQDRVGTELGEYVDPRYVDIDEVREAYETLGLSRPTEDDLSKFVGQYAEADLAGRAEEYLPTARYNSIVQLIDNLAAQQGTTPEVLDALNTVKQDLAAQIEDLGFVIDEATGMVLTEMQATENRLTDLITENEAAGMERDEAIQSAIDALATDLGTTEENILDLLESNQSDLLTEIEGLGTQISDLEQTLLDEIAANEEAGMDRDEALNAAIEAVATDLGTTRDDLLDQLGTTEENLLTEISALEERVGTQIGAVEQSLLDQIAENEAAGMARDEAIQAAINDVAIDLGTTRDALLDQLGFTEENLVAEMGALEERVGTQIGAVEQSLLDQMALYEAAGIDRDIALNTAIGDVSAELGITRDALLDQLGVTEENLLTRLGETETALSEQITGVETALSTEIQNVADILGKPYTDVTQADIDFVSDVIAQQEGTSEFTYTPEQLAYDYNGDGVIDAADLTAIQTQYGITQGTISPETQPEFQFDPTTDTVWGKPTGVFADIATAQEELGQQMLEGQRRQDVNAFRNLLLGQADLFGRQATVKAPDPARIGPAYDWSSIFATPQQQQFYSGFSPYGAYAEGGTVEDLLRLLEDK